MGRSSQDLGGQRGLTSYHQIRARQRTMARAQSAGRHWRRGCSNNSGVYLDIHRGAFWWNVGIRGVGAYIAQGSEAQSRQSSSNVGVPLMPAGTPFSAVDEHPSTTSFLASDLPASRLGDVHSMQRGNWVWGGYSSADYWQSPEAVAKR